jgi:cyclohexadieny/prephenate dehydrogenase
MIIGIIGIGLIGSSLARAFRAHALADSILLYDTHAPHMAEAKALNLGTEYCATPEELARQSDIVFVCTPVATIAGVIRVVAPHLKPGSIITDVGSVKTSVIAEASDLIPSGVAFVPGHPVAGTEHSGPAAGKADLFAGRTYAIIDEATPHSAPALKIAALTEKLGAKPVFMTAAQHDAVLAFVSHLPHIAAFSAVNGERKLSGQLGRDAASLAGSSFRDMTRVAASNTVVWRDIFLNNAQPILAACRLFRDELDALIAAIERGDAAEITRRLEQARAAKQQQNESQRT